MPRGPFEQPRKQELRDQLAAMTILCRALLSRAGGTVVISTEDVKPSGFIKVVDDGNGHLLISLSKITIY